MIVIKKTYELDMCNGPLFRGIIQFAVPLIFTGILQLCFNIADTAVVGRFTGEHALAAVGSTSSLINLILNLVMGLSLGAGIVVGRNYGARNYEETSNSIHTAIAVAGISGVVMLFAGLIVSKPMLSLMGTPESIIDLSTVYMRIFFLGMPANLLYNFGASILRATGDTRRPLIILIIAGLVNLVLNLISVIIFDLGVVGVAVATVVSQIVSAIFVMKILITSDGILNLNWREIKIHAHSLKNIIKFGIPAGIQGVLFNISNVLIQSSINSFGAIVVAGNTAAVNVEGLVHTSTNAVYQTALNFTSQNMGARKYKRIDRIMLISAIMAFTLGLVLGGGLYLFGDTLLRISTSNNEVVSYGLIRISIVGISYGICGLMDVAVGCLRGIGYSILPTVVTLMGACLFRIVWIFTVFQKHRSLPILYMSYPISWTITSTILICCYLFLRKRVFRKQEEQLADLEAE